MKLFVLLMCLGLERFLPIETFLQRQKFFDYYFNLVARLAPLEWKQSHYGLLVFILPLELIVFLLYLIISHYSSGFSLLLFQTLVLLYCLGSFEIYRISAPIPQDLFEKMHRELFSVLFWFACLGSFGALLFRLLVRVASSHKHTTNPIIDRPLVYLALPLAGYLSWFPVRFFTGIQSFVGKISYAFPYWLDHLLTSWEYNDQFTQSIGRLTMGISTEDTLESKHYIKTLELLDRVLLVFLGFLTVFTLLF